MAWVASTFVEKTFSKTRTYSWANLCFKIMALKKKVKLNIKVKVFKYIKVIFIFILQTFKVPIISMTSTVLKKINKN